MVGLTGLDSGNLIPGAGLLLACALVVRLTSIESSRGSQSRDGVGNEGAGQRTGKVTGSVKLETAGGRGGEETGDGQVEKRRSVHLESERGCSFLAEQIIKSMIVRIYWPAARMNDYTKKRMVSNRETNAGEY